MTTRREALISICNRAAALLLFEKSPVLGRRAVSTISDRAEPSVLPPISGPIVVGGWHNDWTPSEWDEEKIPSYPWRGSNAYLEGNDLFIRVTENGSGQVQQNVRALSAESRWEVDVTLASQTPGLIQAPLWTYNKDTRDEVDFEWVGSTGLQLNIYSRGVSVWTKRIKRNDFDRHQVSIEYASGKSIIFVMDGVELARVTPEMTEGGAFPISPMKAYIEAWPSQSIEWAGKWAGAISDLTMTVHGFRQS